MSVFTLGTTLFLINNGSISTTEFREGKLGNKFPTSNDTDLTLLFQFFSTS